MVRGVPSVTGKIGALKSRRAMLDTLLRHLDMVRLSATMATALALSACNGFVDTPGGDDQGSGTPEQEAALTAWSTEAYPVFHTYCASCHGTASSANNDGFTFLQSTSEATMRDQLLGYNPQVVDLNDPAGSRVLTKGSHEGPALMSDQSAAILDWVQKEKTAANAGSAAVLIETAQFPPLLCTGSAAGGSDCPINYVNLDTVGDGFAGAKITFVAQPLGTDLYVSDLYLQAGSAGLYMEHPLFTSWGSGGPQPDLLDRFFDVTLNLMPSDTTEPVCPGSSCDHIGAGEAVFHDFSPANDISISFVTLTPYMAGSGSGSDTITNSGCSLGGSGTLSVFVADVAPDMGTSACESCHAGQNASATAAMALYDSTGALANLSSTTDNTACLAVRQHLNFQDPTNSPLLLAPDPSGGDGAHPFKLSTAAFATFQTGVETWITAENGSGS